MRIIYPNTRGAFGGLHGGYNFQTGAFVYGIEGEVGYLGVRGDGISSIATDYTFSARYGAYGALTGRLGVTTGRTLFYANGGGVVADIKNEGCDDQPGPPDPDHIGRKSGARGGWVAGGGIEHAFDNRWSVRFEYLYMDFGRVTVHDVGDEGGTAGPSSPYDFHNRLHTARLGVTYRFGGGPVVARY